MPDTIRRRCEKPHPSRTRFEAVVAVAALSPDAAYAQAQSSLLSDYLTAFAALDRDGAARMTEVAHDIDHERGRALVLFPAADLAGDAHHGAQPFRLEGRADIDGVAGGRDHDAVQALGELEAQAGEIEAAGRGIEMQRRDAFAAHDRLRFGDPRAQLVIADARDTLAHRAHPAELRLDGRAADAEGHGRVLSPSSSSGTSSAASTRPGPIIAEVKCPAWCDRFIVPSTRPRRRIGMFRIALMPSCASSA